MKMIRNRALMGLATTVALVAMVASAGMAQRSGGQGNYNRQGSFGGFGGFGAAQSPVVKSNSEGVYVLTNGTLIKYSTSLQEKGQVKLQEQPQPSADSSTPQMPRPVPGAMLLTADSKVIVVLGDQLYSVDAALSQTPVKISLPSMQQTPAPATNSDSNSGPGQTGRAQFAMPQPAPSLELQGQIVYVVRGTEIVAVDLAANKVLGLASLPKPAAPARPANND